MRARHPLPPLSGVQLEREAQGGQELGSEGGTVTVHVLGPEEELDILPLFAEVAHLLGQQCQVIEAGCALSMR